MAVPPSLPALSFADALAPVVDTDHYMDAFDITNASHVTDVLIVACWFMMREIEMAGARTSDVEFQDDGACSALVAWGCTLCARSTLWHATSHGSDEVERHPTLPFSQTTEAR